MIASNTQPTFFETAKGTPECLRAIMKRVVNEQPGGFYIVSEELQLRKGQLKDAVSRN